MGDQDGGSVGIAAGTAGDVDGDGYADVVVGAYTYRLSQIGGGAAFVYHGSANGLSATAGWSAGSDRPDARFGAFAKTAGDVNGDGYADLAISAYGYDSGGTMRALPSSTRATTEG